MALYSNAPLISPSSPLRLNWMGLSGLAVFFLLISPEGVLEAQTFIEVTDTPACPGCRIEVSPLVTVRSPPEGPHLVLRSKIARTEDGQIWIAPTSEPSMILRLATGDTVAQPVDLSSHLPRTAGIDRIYSQAERLHVFSGGTWLVIDTEGGVIERGQLPLFPMDFVSLPDTGYVAQFHLASQSEAGFPLHNVTPSLGVTSSFGSIRPHVSPQDGWDRLRALAGDGAGCVWSGRQDRYELERWDPVERTLLARLRRTLPAFEPRLVHGPLMTALRDLHAEENGRLWVLIAVPEVGAPIPEEASWRQHYRDPRNLRANWTTVIEVLDPIQGRVLATSEMDGLHEQFAGELTHSLGVDEQGQLFIEIWELRFLF